MRFVIILLATCLLLSHSAFAQAVLIEEIPPEPQELKVESTRTTGRAGRRMREEVKQGSFLNESRGFQSVLREGHYSTAEAMRTERRVGAGVETLGRLGFVGVAFELNYGSLDAATVGVGGGPGYNSMNLGWKHVFGGHEVSPYAGLSVTRWGGNSPGGFDGTTPSYLEQKFLTENEKRSGQFAKYFVVPSAGIQVNRLVGPSAGAALFAEVLFLVEASTMAYVPTGALGALYYF